MPRGLKKRVAAQFKLLHKNGNHQGGKNPVDTRDNT